jgi:eukaryotic-like serine/threonine-protein kinase
VAFGPEIPDKVGRYEIVLPIARGGMATVYLARSEGHGGFDRYVALKLTAEHLRDDPEFAQHLVEEAKLIAHLRHTNVVPVLDVGEDEVGAVFLVMEYVPGDSLGGLYRIAKKTNGIPVPPRVGLRVVVDALAGLHAAHEHADEDGKPHSLVHRDFSPQNILVGTDGIARLTDFGIAKASSRASITVAGTMKGKVSYASPEQARGKPLDRRCDVWAAGVVAWEIVTGRKLYPASERTLLEIVGSPPPRLRDVMPEVSEELDEIIDGALTVKLEKRTPTAQMFGRLLAQAARNADMLAEIEEVAEHVQLAVAPILAERKAKIANARKAREAQAPPTPEMVETGPQLPKPPSTEIFGSRTVPLPSLPDVPMVTHRIDNASTVPASVADALSGSQRTLRNDEITGGSGSLPGTPASSPSITPSGTSTTAAVSTPPVPPRSVRPPPETDPGEFAKPNPWRQSLLSFHEIKQSVLDRVTRFIADRPLLVLGGASAMAGLLLLSAVVIFVLSSSSSSPPPPAPPAVAGPPPSASVAAVPKAAPPPSTSSSADPSPVATAPQLVLTANAPIAKARIGKRAVDVEVPAPKVIIDLTQEESATTTPLSIVVTSTDGRFATGTWSSASDLDLNLTFGAAKPATTVKPKPLPTTPTKRH